MTHRIIVNVQTGEVTQVEYTAEEQAAYDTAKIVNDEAARLAEEAKLAEQTKGA
jgi:2-oxoglutarate dehydrogenase complex dehydrogenase (E1) component-like enzyme